MKKNINRTLKMKLLISPKPVCNKKEFFQIRYRMFGNETDIMEFLDTSETLKKIAIAKKIVYRLAFQSNFSPSLELLDFLAEFEKTIRYNRSVTHQSRDHYIHICYLYLLGIYLFFYMPELNDKLHDSLSLIRYSGYLNEEDNFVKSFLGAWKYFVLFHDIAYPLEYLGDSKKKYNSIEKEAKKKAEDLYRLSSIREGMLNILSIKILARIIAIGNAIEDLSARSYNLFSYLERNSDKFVEIDGGEDLLMFIERKRNDDISYLQNVKCGDDIKIFLSVFECEDFFVAFKEDSAIKCIIDSKYCYVSKDSEKDDVIIEISKNRELLFRDELFERCVGFQIEFYGVNLNDKYEKFVSNIKLQKTVLQNLDFDIKNIGNIQEMSFECFLKCYDYSKKMRNKATGKSIRCGCREALFKEFKKINVDVGELVKDGYYEYAGKCLQQYKKEIKACLKKLNMDSLKNQVVHSVNEENQYISNISLACTIIKNALNEELRTLVDIKIDSVWALYNVKCFNQIFGILEESTKTYVEESLQKSTESEYSLCDILKNYHMEYTQYDHGITAAMIFALHFTIYQKILKKCRENDLLCVGFNIPNAVDEDVKAGMISQKYIADYERSSGQVIYAILIHNLYPDNFKMIKGIRTGLDSNPFSFFCMLCDALQNWGRPFNVDPMKEEYPRFVDALKYNIKLGKYITVKFEEDNPEVIREFLNPFTEALDQYLDGVSKMLRVIFK